MNYSGVELEKMVAKKDREILRLREEVKRLQLTLQEVQMSTANYISHLQEQLAHKTEDVKRLEAKLQSRHDYRRMKEELRILKERRWPLGNSVLIPSMSSLASEEADSDMQEEILLETPLAENNLDAEDTDVEIKMEEMPSDPLSNQRVVPSLCTQSPSEVTSQDALPQLCIKTEDDSDETDSMCQTGENEGGNSPTLSGNAVDARLLEEVEKQQVKQDLIQKHNISQHVPGRDILGLLHGGVNEILAHSNLTKWCQLTAKELFQRPISPLNPPGETDSDDTIRNILEHATRELHSQNGEVASDDTIKNILEYAKSKLQSQNGVAAKERRTQSYHSSYNRSHFHDDEGKGSEDIIKSILGQARHEMQIQDLEDQLRGPLPNSVMASELRVKLEEEEEDEEERRSVGQFSPSLGVVSPVDFVQEIIRKVKSEIGAEGTFYTSSENPVLCSSLNHRNSSPLPQELHLSENNQDHLSSKGQDERLSPVIRCDKGHSAMNQSATKDYCVETTYTGNLASESYKENFQPPQVQAGQNKAGAYSQPHPEVYGGLDIQQLVLQTPELDTLSLTRRVKEILLNNNLGQQLFGEKVLALSQGSVSDLLSRPKPWRQLSRKGKEPFLRMHIWLNDPRNVEQLKTMKRLGHRGLVNISKRPRVVLTDGQKEELKRAYQVEPYPSFHDTQRLASHLGLQHSTVTNWFNNHRSRSRHSTQDVRTSTFYSNSHFLDADLVTQYHSREANPCSSPTHMHTNPVIIKQEASDLKISDVRGDMKDIYHGLKYVSTGIQSCRNLKQEDEDDKGVLSPQLDDEKDFGNIIVKELGEVSRSP